MTKKAEILQEDVEIAQARLQERETLRNREKRFKTIRRHIERIVEIYGKPNESKTTATLIGRRIELHGVPFNRKLDISVTLESQQFMNGAVYEDGVRATDSVNVKFQFFGKDKNSEALYSKSYAMGIDPRSLDFRANHNVLMSTTTKEKSMDAELNTLAQIVTFAEHRLTRPAKRVRKSTR